MVTGSSTCTRSSTWARASSRGITPTRYKAGASEAFDELLEVRTERGTEVVASCGELDHRAQVVELVAGVVPALGERVAVHVLFLHQQRDRVGELQLAADARLHLGEGVEDV